VSKAADLAVAIQSHRLTISESIATKLVDSLAAVGQLDRALQFVDSWLAANTDQLETEEAKGPHKVLTTLLEVSARGDDPDMLLQVLVRMARVGLAPAPESIASLQQLFCRLGQFDTAIALLDWMRRSDMEPTGRHYVSCMPPALPFQKAVRLYESLKQRHVEPTIQFYAAYITICGRAGQIAAALLAWQEMLDAGLKPNVVAYSALLDIYERKHDGASALKAYDDMIQSGIKPDSMAYATVLGAVQRGPKGAAQRVWEEYMASRVKPHIEVAHNYVAALVHQGEVGLIQRLLQQRVLWDKRDATALWEGAITASIQAHKVLPVELLDCLDASHVELTHTAVAKLMSAVARMRKLQHSWLLNAPAGTEFRALQFDNFRTEILRGLRQMFAGEVGNEKPFAEISELEVKDTLNADEAAVLVGWLAIEGRSTAALELYRKFATVMTPTTGAWALQALLFTAQIHSIEPKERKALALHVIQEARRWKEAGNIAWFDNKMQRAAVKLLRNVANMAV
jgi:pentatricopeptide repeat protein